MVNNRDLGFRVRSSRFRVKGLGFRVSGLRNQEKLGFRV